MFSQDPNEGNLIHIGLFIFARMYRDSFEFGIMNLQTYLKESKMT